MVAFAQRNVRQIEPEAFCFQPSRSSPAQSAGTYYVGQTHHGFFCGNNAVNRWDYLGMTDDMRGTFVDNAADGWTVRNFTGAPDSDWKQMTSTGWRDSTNKVLWYLEADPNEPFKENDTNDWLFAENGGQVAPEQSSFDFVDQSDATFNSMWTQNGIANPQASLAGGQFVSYGAMIDPSTGRLIVGPTGRIAVGVSGSNVGGRRTPYEPPGFWISLGQGIVGAPAFWTEAIVNPYAPGSMVIAAIEGAGEGIRTYVSFKADGAVNIIPLVGGKYVGPGLVGAGLGAEISVPLNGSLPNVQPNVSAGKFGLSGSAGINFAAPGLSGPQVYNFGISGGAGPGGALNISFDRNFIPTNISLTIGVGYGLEVSGNLPIPTDGGKSPGG